MRHGKIIAAGILLFSLSLVTVGVQDRVVVLRRELYRELLRVHDLEGEALAWWWKVRAWRTPEGRRRLLRLLGKEAEGPEGRETSSGSGIRGGDL